MEINKLKAALQSERNTDRAQEVEQVTKFIFKKTLIWLLYFWLTFKLTICYKLFL